MYIYGTGTGAPNVGPEARPVACGAAYATSYDIMSCYITEYRIVS